MSVSVDQDMNRCDINIFISNKVTTSLAKLVGKPLGAESLPELQDLTPVWDRWERALQGINANVRLANINSRGIENLGPILLGDAAWRAVAQETMLDWLDFKSVVTNRFGLTTSEMRRRFYDQQPTKGEAACDFVTRVEAERS